MLRYVIPLAVFLGLAALLWQGLGRNPSVVPSPLIDKPVPQFSLGRLKATNQRFDSADLAGEVCLLNVWASWCPQCRTEHPMLEQIARSGIVPVYGLNWKDKREDALRWLQRFGDPYAAIAHDPDNEVGIDFGVYGAPETFLIDAEGRIRYKHIGALTPQIWRDKLRPMIERLKNQSRQTGTQS